MLKEMTKLLYDEVDGVFVKLRNCNYEENEKEIEKILDWSRELNSKIKAKIATVDEVLFAFEMERTLRMFSDVAKWTEDVANKIYQNIFINLELDWRE